MRCNLALWDRVLRFIFGFLLTTFAIAGGPAWCYVGIVFLLTSASCYCPVYALLGIKTYRRKNKDEA